MQVFQADYVYPADRAPLRNAFVALDERGQITYVGEEAPEGTDKVCRVAGALVPGFINTHCHLELSHLKGRMDTGTGLLPFLKSVVRLRDTDPEVIQECIREADRAMWESGIQAVGDISNTADTAAVKAASPIQYFTFVEAFDFLQGGSFAADTFARAQEVFTQHPDPKRYVPHAPYTVSPELFARLEASNQAGGTVSIHNQETPAEDQLFKTGGGDFTDFYRDFNFSLEQFEAPGTSSLQATLPYLNPHRRNLFVHNTCTTADDVEAAEEWSEKVYWASCPNANLYIENRLPDYRMLDEEGVRMTIGTDSLTSNWQLSILEELKTIRRFFSALPTRTLIQWATLNGAEALGFDAQLGSLTEGKIPGLLALEHLDANGEIGSLTTVRRLA